MDIRKFLIKLLRSFIDALESSMSEHIEGEPRPDEDIYGNKFNPLQRFIQKATASAIDFGGTDEEE